MLKRLLHVVAASVIGFVCGFAEYIGRGANWQMHLHRHGHTLIQVVGWTYFYIRVAAFFVLPTALLFSFIYFIARPTLFRRWFVSLPLGASLGCIVSVIVLYGLYYRHPGMARTYLHIFVPRTAIAGAAMFLVATFLTLRHGASNQALQLTADRSVTTLEL